MAYVRAVYDGIFFVRWQTAPDVLELDRLLDDLARTQQRHGRKMIYVAAIGADVDVPAGIQRHALAKFGERATPFVSETHLILEGDGFKHSIQRSVVTAIYVIKGGPVPVHIWKSVGEAVEAIGRRLGRPPAMLAHGLGVPEAREIARVA
jgi:hypothetical protein